ncbi:hypothetical protein PENTCL1PPCAC_22111, partial [Pristionchus entomophagus]
QRAKRSPETIKAIRRSLRNLICQLLIPFSLFTFPAITIFFGIIIENFLSFETSFGLFLIMPWHSVGHNLILLTITSAYRQRILAIILK